MEQYFDLYDSPIGELTIINDGKNLNYLYFRNTPNYDPTWEENSIRKENKISKIVKDWLDDYFSGKDPDPSKIPIDLKTTEFRKKILPICQNVKFGEVSTYGDLAREYTKTFNKRIAFQAVGQAMRHNPIVIIIPCHRIICSNCRTGNYSCGNEKKRWLIDFEKKQVWEQKNNIKES